MKNNREPFKEGKTMAAITDKRRHRSRKQGLQTGVLTANGESKGLVKDEANTVSDLFLALFVGSILTVLLFALLNWP